MVCHAHDYSLHIIFASPFKNSFAQVLPQNKKKKRKHRELEMKRTMRGGLCRLSRCRSLFVGILSFGVSLHKGWSCQSTGTAKEKIRGESGGASGPYHHDLLCRPTNHGSWCWKLYAAAVTRILKFIFLHLVMQFKF